MFCKIIIGEKLSEGKRYSQVHEVFPSVSFIHSGHNFFLLSIGQQESAKWEGQPLFIYLTKDRKDERAKGSWWLSQAERERESQSNGPQFYSDKFHCITSQKVCNKSPPAPYCLDYKIPHHQTAYAKLSVMASYLPSLKHEQWQDQ